MIDVIADRGAAPDGGGLDGKSRLCEHTGSLISDPDHLAFDKAA